MPISLISGKINVLIVGGGRAGFIKAKSFSERGCSVYVLARNFIEEFNYMKDMDRIVLIEGDYCIEHIKDKHIIVIATGDLELDSKIKSDCESMYKVYLTCSNYKEGLFVTPVSVGTENIQIAVNTKHGSPKTSLLIGDVLKKKVNEYDGFAGYVCSLRQTLKDSGCLREIMDFVNTHEFFEFYNKGYQDKVLKMFYGGIIIET